MSITQMSVKEMLKALCLEFQLGFSQPRNLQECIDLANSVLQSSMLEFGNDRVVQSNIGAVSESGFRISLAFTEEETNGEPEQV